MYGNYECPKCHDKWQMKFDGSYIEYQDNESSDPLYVLCTKCTEAKKAKIARHNAMIELLKNISDNQKTIIESLNLIVGELRQPTLNNNSHDNQP